MNKTLKNKMIDGWHLWHSEMENPPDIPPAYRRGFCDACDFILPLLRRALPLVEATAEASHLVDGFGPRDKNNHDRLVDLIVSVIGELDDGSNDW